jgi:hypothetical protein
MQSPISKWCCLKVCLITQLLNVFLLSPTGSVRALCPLAPNNVNTMASAAIAGHNLGFDLTKARLVSDPK